MSNAPVEEIEKDDSYAGSETVGEEQEEVPDHKQRSDEEDVEEDDEQWDEQNEESLDPDDDEGEEDLEDAGDSEQGSNVEEGDEDEDVSQSDDEPNEEEEEDEEEEQQGEEEEDEQQSGRTISTSPPPPSAAVPASAFQSAFATSAATAAAAPTNEGPTPFSNVRPSPFASSASVTTTTTTTPITRPAVTSTASTVAAPFGGSAFGAAAPSVNITPPPPSPPPPPAVIGVDDSMPDGGNAEGEYDDGLLTFLQQRAPPALRGTFSIPPNANLEFGSTFALCGDDGSTKHSFFEVQCRIPAVESFSRSSAGKETNTSKLRHPNALDKAMHFLVQWYLRAPFDPRMYVAPLLDDSWEYLWDRFRQIRTDWTKQLLMSTNDEACRRRSQWLHFSVAAMFVGTAIRSRDPKGCREFLNKSKYNVMESISQTFTDLVLLYRFEGRMRNAEFVSVMSLFNGLQLFQKTETRANFCMLYHNHEYAWFEDAADSVKLQDVYKELAYYPHLSRHRHVRNCLLLLHALHRGAWFEFFRLCRDLQRELTIVQRCVLINAFSYARFRAVMDIVVGDRRIMSVVRWRGTVSLSELTDSLLFQLPSHCAAFLAVLGLDNQLFWTGGTEEELAEICPTITREALLQCEMDDDLISSHMALRLHDAEHKFLTNAKTVHEHVATVKGHLWWPPCSAFVGFQPYWPIIRQHADQFDEDILSANCPVNVMEQLEPYCPTYNATLSNAILVDADEAMWFHPIAPARRGMLRRGRLLDGWVATHEDGASMAQLQREMWDLDNEENEEFRQESNGDDDDDDHGALFESTHSVDTRITGGAQLGGQSDVHGEEENDDAEEDEEKEEKEEEEEVSASCSSEALIAKVLAQPIYTEWLDRQKQRRAQQIDEFIERESEARQLVVRDEATLRENVVDAKAADRKRIGPGIVLRPTSTVAEAAAPLPQPPSSVVTLSSFTGRPAPLPASNVAPLAPFGATSAPTQVPPAVSVPKAPPLSTFSTLSATNTTTTLPQLRKRHSNDEDDVEEDREKQENARKKRRTDSSETAPPPSSVGFFAPSTQKFVCEEVPLSTPAVPSSAAVVQSPAQLPTHSASPFSSGLSTFSPLPLVNVSSLPTGNTDVAPLLANRESWTHVAPTTTTVVEFIHYDEEADLEVSITSRSKIPPPVVVSPLSKPSTAKDQEPTAPSSRMDSPGQRRYASLRDLVQQTLASSAILREVVSSKPRTRTKRMRDDSNKSNQTSPASLLLRSAPLPYWASSFSMAQCQFYSGAFRVGAVVDRIVQQDILKQQQQQQQHPRARLSSVSLTPEQQELHDAWMRRYVRSVASGLNVTLRDKEGQSVVELSSIIVILGANRQPPLPQQQESTNNLNIMEAFLTRAEENSTTLAQQIASLLRSEGRPEAAASDDPATWKGGPTNQRSAAHIPLWNSGSMVYHVKERKVVQMPRPARTKEYYGQQRPQQKSVYDDDAFLFEQELSMTNDTLGELDSTVQCYYLEERHLPNLHFRSAAKQPPPPHQKNNAEDGTSSSSLIDVAAITVLHCVELDYLTWTGALESSLATGGSPDTMSRPPTLSAMQALLDEVAPRFASVRSLQVLARKAAEMKDFLLSGLLVMVQLSGVPAGVSAAVEAEVSRRAVQVLEGMFAAEYDRQTQKMKAKQQELVAAALQSSLMNSSFSTSAMPSKQMNQSSSATTAAASSSLRPPLAPCKMDKESFVPRSGNHRRGGLGVGSYSQERSLAAQSFSFDAEETAGNEGDNKEGETRTSLNQSMSEWNDKRAQADISNEQFLEQVRQVLSSAPRKNIDTPLDQAISKSAKDTLDSVVLVGCPLSDVLYAARRQRVASPDVAIRQALLSCFAAMNQKFVEKATEAAKVYYAADAGRSIDVFSRQFVASPMGNF